MASDAGAAGATPSEAELKSIVHPDGKVEDAPIVAAAEKAILEKEALVRKYIQENLSRIKDVEKELAGLTLEAKLTSGPKKAALELLRKKIEQASERIKQAKIKEEAAKKVLDAASKVVQDEEAEKARLCEDLNQLVQQSAMAQFQRLDDLTKRLDALNPAHVQAAANGQGDEGAHRFGGFEDAGATERKNSVPEGSQKNPLPGQAGERRVSFGTATSSTEDGEGERNGGAGQRGGSPSPAAGKHVPLVKGRTGGSRGGRTGRLILGAKGGAKDQGGWTGAGFNVEDHDESGVAQCDV